MSILFCPLNIPRIEPKDWDEWWDTWAKSKIMPKVNKNHNKVALDWLGLDLYANKDFQTQYEAPLAEQNPTVVDLCKQVTELMNFHITRIRVIENLVPILPHTDNSKNMPNVRSFLWNTYPMPVWTFRDKHETRQLIMPEDSNSFYYLDGAITHESIYDARYSKGVLAVYGRNNGNNFNSMIEDSYKKYSHISWKINEDLK
jgi:hypothetical protein